MPIDTPTIYASIYNRLASDSAGATLRALLGQSTRLATLTGNGNNAAIFPVDMLETVKAINVDRPWIAVKDGEIAGSSGSIRDCFTSLWIYTSGRSRSYDMRVIKAAIDDLFGYTNRHSISGGFLKVVFSGRAVEEATDLDSAEMRVTYSQFG